MRHYKEEFSVRTGKRLEIIDITDDVSRVVGESGIKTGLVNIWVPHATAAVAVNEHDPDLWVDVLSTFERLVPVKGDYHHNAKYGWAPSEQNAHAHILNCMVKPDVTIPVYGGRMQLGTWQSILFIELDGPRVRRVRVTVLGE